MSPNQPAAAKTTPSPDAYTYAIEITGRIAQADLEMMCPAGLVVHKKVGLNLTFEVITDQSGLMGLLRHLHSRGVVFEEIKRTIHLP